MKRHLSKKKFNYTFINKHSFKKSTLQHDVLAPKLLFTPTSLLKAIEQEKQEKLPEMLKYIESCNDDIKKLFVNETNEQQQNVLMLAASKGYYEIVERLLSLNFNVNDKDAFGLTVTNYLKKSHITVDNLIPTIRNQNEITKTQAEALIEHIDYLIKRIDKKEFTNLLTRTDCYVNQKGHVPKIKPEVSRPYRSYIGEREPQILRQVATQLYFAFKDYLQSHNIDVKPLKEIQIMHQRDGSKHNLFIAMNDYVIAERFLNYIQNTKYLEKILTEIYLTQTEEGNIRSERYAEKLTDRVYNNLIPATHFANKNEKLQTDAIIDILKNGSIINCNLDYDKNQLRHTSQSLINQLINKNDKMIYIVVPTGFSFKNRHAEEFLTDIAEVIKQSSPDAYFCLAGKKRPCSSCSGRMQGVINAFSQYPGRFWGDTLRFQNETDASKTIKNLLTTPSHVSIGKDEKTLCHDYTSGSDSEGEELTFLMSLKP